MLSACVHTSGALLSPSVTVSVWLRGGLPRGETFHYIMLQTAGAIAACEVRMASSCCCMSTRNTTVTSMRTFTSSHSMMQVTWFLRGTMPMPMPTGSLGTMIGVEATLGAMIVLCHLSVNVASDVRGGSSFLATSGGAAQFVASASAAGASGLRLHGSKAFAPPTLNAATTTGLMVSGVLHEGLPKTADVLAYLPAFWAAAATGTFVATWVFSLSVAPPSSAAQSGTNANSAEMERTRVGVRVGGPSLGDYELTPLGAPTERRSKGRRQASGGGGGGSGSGGFGDDFDGGDGENEHGYDMDSGVRGRPNVRSGLLRSSGGAMGSYQAVSLHASMPNGRYNEGESHGTAGAAVANSNGGASYLSQTHVHAHEVIT